jgi:iduronate 2-sulfatase
MKSFTRVIFSFRFACLRSAITIALAVSMFNFAFYCESVSAEEQTKKWNVLFLMSDDMRPTLGCYGHNVVQSPNIDSLAQRGVRFDRAYCQYPLCNPSRTSLLTGRHPTTSGVVDNNVDFRAAHPEWVSLPQHFRANGYASLRCGKIFHGGIDDAKAWDEGGDPARPDSSPRKPLNQTDRIRRSDQLVVLENEGQEHADYRVADQAIQYLQRYRDKPFFLACGFTKPHSPPTAPKKLFDLYDVAKLKLPRTFAAVPAAPNGFPKDSITSNRDLFIDREASEEEARLMLQAYYASVSWTDWNVGRVLSELDRLGLRESTIVVFWGDHGYHLGEFGKWAKHGSLFELGTRVPLIVFAPTMPEVGKVVQAPVQALDLYPTLCSLCGLEKPTGIEGHDLRPLLQNVQSEWNHPAFSVAGSQSNLGVAVRTRKYRYAEWDGGKNGAMLIDEQADPDETTNLVNDPKHAHVVAELSGLAKQHAKDPSKGMPLVFSDDFEQGSQRWETTDDTNWKLTKEGKNQVFGISRRVSDYKPTFRSPHNIAMIKGIELSDFVLIYKVKSTNDTGGHRDCCTFFCHQDANHFYYVHLGAVPDPHSGQFMIVDNAPRLALTKNEKKVAWDNDWHTVKLVRDSKSGTTEVYFDDMESPHMTMTNRTFAKGRIGIGSFDDMNDFDDVRLYGK